MPHQSPNDEMRNPVKNVPKDGYQKSSSREKKCTCQYEEGHGLTCPLYERKEFEEKKCDGTCEAAQESTGGCPCDTCHGNRIVRHPLAKYNKEWTGCPNCNPDKSAAPSTEGIVSEEVSQLVNDALYEIEHMPDASIAYDQIVFEAASIDEWSEKYKRKIQTLLSQQKEEFTRTLNNSRVMYQIGREDERKELAEKIRSYHRILGKYPYEEGYNQAISDVLSSLKDKK